MKKLLSCLATSTLIAMPLTSTFFTVSCGAFNSRIQQILDTNYKKVFSDIEKNLKQRVNESDEKFELRKLEEFIRYLILEFDTFSLDMKNSVYAFDYNKDNEIVGWNSKSTLSYLKDIDLDEIEYEDHYQSIKEKLNLNKLVNNSWIKIEKPNIQLLMAYMLSVLNEMTENEQNPKSFILEKLEEFEKALNGQNLEIGEDDPINLEMLDYAFTKKDPVEKSKEMVREIYIPRKKSVFKEKDDNKFLENESLDIFKKYFYKYNAGFEGAKVLEVETVQMLKNEDKKSGTTVCVKMKPKNDDSSCRNTYYRVTVFQYLDKYDLQDFIKHIWKPQVIYGLSLPIWRILTEEKAKSNSVKVKFNKQIVKLIDDHFCKFLKYIKENSKKDFEYYKNWENYKN